MHRSRAHAGRRCIALGLALSFVAAPLTALAYFMQPSALFRAMEFDGRPRSLSMEAHAQMEDTYMSFWMHGEGEGRTPSSIKGKWHATFDLSADDVKMRVKLDLLLHQQVAYFRINEFSTNFEDDVLRASVNVLQKKWLSIPLEVEQVQAGGRDAFVTGFVEGMEQEGISVSKDQVEKLLDNLVDAVLSLEYTQFTGGHAYSLRLKEGFIRETLLTVDEFFSGINGEGLGISGLLNDPIMQEVESMLHDTANLHIKVNTNDDDQFLFARFYLSVETPDLPGFSFVTQGEVQKQMVPVYVGVPTNSRSMTMEELLEYMDGGNILHQLENLNLLNTGELFEWTEDEDTFDQDWDTWDSGSDWWEEEGEEWQPRRTSRQQEVHSDVGCTGSPDSLEYLFNSRKGICPLADRDRGVRINTQNSAKRQRQREVEEQRRRDHMQRVESFQRRVEE